MCSVISKTENPFTDLQVLVRLGLTLKQAKVYLAMVMSGTLNVLEISKISKVAVSDVYKVLLKLKSKGLVEKIITNPRKYKAISIEAGTNHLLKIKTDEYRTLRGETQILVNMINKSKQRRKREIQKELENPAFFIVPKGICAIEKIKTAIETTQLSIDAILSWKRFSRGIINYFAESLEKAQTKKVKIRLLIENPLANKTANQLIQYYKKKFSAQTRFLYNYPATIFGIYDKKEISIATESKADLKGCAELWSSNPSLISLAQDHFEELWLRTMEEPRISQNGS